MGFNARIKKLAISMHKYKFLLLAAVCGTIVLFAGCQGGHTNTGDWQATDSKGTENYSTDTTMPGESNTEESNIAGVTASVEGDSSGELTLQFSELSKYQFVFSSGAGAWQTMLNINDDGTFKGYYSDSDMGDIGEDYPNGIIYSSTFEGKFTTPERINDYTYSVSIESVKLAKEAGTEEIIDGIKYIYTEPHGLSDSKEIYIYTPQASLEELPEGFRSWVGYRDLSNVEGKHLPFYGLYNVETDSGFSSYEIDK